MSWDFSQLKIASLLNLWLQDFCFARSSTERSCWRPFVLLKSFIYLLFENTSEIWKKKFLLLEVTMMKLIIFRYFFFLIWTRWILLKQNSETKFSCHFSHAPICPFSQRQDNCYLPSIENIFTKSLSFGKRFCRIKKTQQTLYRISKIFPF